jgi:tetratricopeptide (TPR) repeat protein
MALFGAPVAVEDAPRHALTAALGIQRAIAPLDAEIRQRHERNFRMRIGIHTGPVVVGKIGDDLRMDYTAIGDTTNLAARLEQIARPGSVVISAATRRLVEGYFELRELPPARVKGKTSAVHAWEVLAELPVSGRIEALSETDLTPYVGRERELDALRAAFESACDGHGQVAFIVGDAGIGKSRLLHEFRRRLAEVPHSWLEGRCASYARTTAFHAIGDALRRRMGIDERDDEASALTKLAHHEVARGGQLEWTLPFVRRLLSLPAGDVEVDAMDAMIRRSETCRALQARFLRSAEQRPLVLVIEDVHWIDAASEEFLGFLADSIAAARVLLVFTHRPGYQHPFGDRSFHVRVPLQALSDEGMAAMVGSVLDTEVLPPELRRLIAAKAEGNPLFIEEITRSLLEEGVLSVERGRVALARNLAEVAVPDRIQDVLMARLDRLPAEPKRAIQIASVIGREFALRLLERITEVGERLDGIVGELRALELIYEKASHPELAYMFKHALTHDVAYESVLVQRRKALHRIVGSAIEELYRDRLVEHYEALAHHFTEAEEWEGALRYHELASEKSTAAYANHAAAEHCRSALAIADRLGDAVPDARLRALAARLARCCWCVSDFRASGEAYRRAADLAEDPRQRSMDVARAGHSFLWGHDYDRAREAEAESLALAREHGADAAHAFGLIVEDEHESTQGRRLTGDFDPEHAIELAERSGNTSVVVACYSQIAQRCEWRGEYRRAIHFAERALALAARKRLTSDTTFPQWWLGIGYVAIGEYGRGIGILSQGLELCDRIGDRAVKARLLNTLGWCYAEFGCHDRASEYNRMGTDLAREMVELGLVPGAPELYANAAVNLAGNLTALGDLDGASEQLAPIQAQLDSDDDPWMRWRYSLHLLHGLARVHLARGEPERALAASDAELAGARRNVAKKLEARALELRGRALLVLDRRDEASGALREALAVAGQIEYPPVLWRALSLSGELARRAGDTAVAERRFGEARSLVEAKAHAVPEPGLQREFRSLGERLVTDPLGAHR